MQKRYQTAMNPRSHCGIIAAASSSVSTISSTGSGLCSRSWVSCVAYEGRKRSSEHETAVSHERSEQASRRCWRANGPWFQSKPCEDFTQVTCARRLATIFAGQGAGKTYEPWGSVLVAEVDDRVFRLRQRAPCIAHTDEQEHMYQTSLPRCCLKKRGRSVKHTYQASWASAARCALQTTTAAAAMTATRRAGPCPSRRKEWRGWSWGWDWRWSSRARSCRSSLRPRSGVSGLASRKSSCLVLASSRKGRMRSM